MVLDSTEVYISMVSQFYILPNQSKILLIFNTHDKERRIYVVDEDVERIEGEKSETFEYIPN